MCGICGVYEYEDRNAVSEQALLAMLRAIVHRGPDDEGTFIEAPSLALGMRRLSIIDLAGGQQPIYSEDGGVVIVFNGEIYNYLALRTYLEDRGHVFKTSSDTEVIVHLYEEKGEDCVQDLRGMFAFAIWDRRRKKLFIARDRLGIKPVYYTLSNGALIFGSEIKALLQHPAVEARPDLEGLSHFLSLRYVPAPQTMFQNIVALPPGHVMSCDEHGVTTRCYWDISFVRDPDAKIEREEVYAERLDALLHESVEMRLMSDVPFGAFLSGGIDSSTIVALMSKYLNEPVKTFSVGFHDDGAGFSELTYARMVAERYQTDHHEVFIEPHSFTDLMEDVIWHLDQPIADMATPATYMLAKFATQHVKMVLTGEGGDELFAGYARYAGERFSPLFRRIPKPARRLAVEASMRLPGLRRPKIALYALSFANEPRRFVNWFPLFNYDMKVSLLSPRFKAALTDVSSASIFAEHLARTDAPDPISRLLYVDSKLWLVDDLLARGDKMTMAASLEGRVPILDHKLVEFAASLPPEFKVNRLARKYLLKKVSRTLLPDEIIDRKKQGFPVPLLLWFRDEARPFVRDVLSPSAIKRRGLFNLDYVEKLLDEHEQGFADHALLIWGLLNVELWYRLFIDEQARMRVGG